MKIWTYEALQQVAPNGEPFILDKLALLLDDAFAAAGMDKALEQAHFVAQICHESAGFRTTVEYASGAAYEGRADLGNVQDGDGRLFKGRGLIQLTGRDNYRTYGYMDDPRAVAAFPAALEVSIQYWLKRRLGRLALKDDIKTITKRINGGLNGFVERKQALKRAKRIVRSHTDAWVEANFKRLGYGDLKTFQKDHGLKPDGIVGRLTRAKMQQVLKQREADKAKSNVKSGAGALGVGMAGKALTDAADQIEPLKDALPILGYVFTALTLLGVGFVIWSIVKKQIAPEEVHDL